MKGIWCKKIGMTQLFREDGVVVPVTVLDTGKWVVTQVKTAMRDGYYAIQIGCVRSRYSDQSFAPEWLAHKQQYFECVREVPAVEGGSIVAQVGDTVDVAAIFEPRSVVDISGTTIGRGFQGGVKRHGFSGGRGSHGDKLGRQPGSMGFMRSRGRVIKGWRMAGHMGCAWKTVKGLEVVTVAPEQRALIVQGSVPGKSGSLLFVCRDTVGEKS